jgi:CRP/FNR family transcriptional regulator
MKRRATLERGPSLKAAPFHATGTGEPVRLLSNKQRQELAALGTRVTFSARRVIYREDAIASSLYFCSDGAVKTYRELPGGTRRVMSFLFADDVFGLARAGRYVNTAQAMTETTCYRIPIDELTAVLQQDPALQYQFLHKLTHELREAQRRAIIMGRRDTPGRLAMFLMMLKDRLPESDPDVIPLPMSRSDIAGYLGHSLEAVSRATARLSQKGILAFEGRHAARVLDRARLERLAADV